MSARGNVRATERALKRHARAARADGIALIFGAFDGCDQHWRPGLCILGAYNAYCAGEEIALPDESDALGEAWDSIESGWDGTPHKLARTQSGARVVKRWWSMGYRLRRALKPTRAAT